MYKKLDEYLSGYFKDDYWYDEGVIIAQEMLNKFTKNDWVNLIAELKMKPLQWQIKYAYIADAGINDKSIAKSLFLLMENDNEELNEVCKDSLRCITSKHNFENN